MLPILPLNNITNLQISHYNIIDIQKRTIDCTVALPKKNDCDINDDSDILSIIITG